MLEKMHQLMVEVRFQEFDYFVGHADPNQIV
jgi:hypothetical protein